MWLSRYNPFRKRPSEVREALHLAQEKQEEIDELKKLEAYRREFLGNVSHELKTPLFNIQGYLLTLLDGAKDDPGILKDYLQRSEKNIDRMIAIIDDLETISQFETGEMKLNVIRFDIKALTREVVDLLETKAKKKNITIRCAEQGAAEYFVKGDKERIRQVLINLVDNSIKYGNEGGFTAISFAEKETTVETTVSDNGIGVSAKDLPRLFERFFRVDKSRSREQGGSGLGLAIVKHIMEAHGSSVNVTSAPNEGSVFTFRLKKP
jgi:two-component system, OmpR family, phosphate regulon sensor histidine kinase PhoR